MADTTAAPPATPGVLVDPYRAYNFKLSIQGVVQGHFTRVERLGVRVPRILYREAGDHATVRSIPGPVEYATVTLKYGLTSSTELIDWLFQVVGGQIQRQNVSILLLDDAGATTVREWRLIDAWPCEWYGAPLDALGQEIAIEAISLAYDRLEIEHAAPSSPTP